MKGKRSTTTPIDEFLEIFSTNLEKLEEEEFNLLDPIYNLTRKKTWCVQKCVNGDFCEWKVCQSAQVLYWIMPFLVM